LKIEKITLFPERKYQGKKKRELKSEENSCAYI